MRNFLTLTYIISSVLFTSHICAQNPKFNLSQIANAPCVDEGFEGLTVGPLVSGAWIPYYQTGVYSDLLCGSPSYTTGNILTNVVNTPTTDSYYATNLFTVQPSPYAGTKVLRINNNNIPASKVEQTFSVTAGNFVYRYAYMGFINGGHVYCQSPAIVFQFYNCANTLIAAYSKTISDTSNPDAAYWTNSAAYTLTPNWVDFDINLVNYIGSCVKVVVATCGCFPGGHSAYCYYDAECSDKFMTINGKLASSAAYTSCVNTATLGVLSGFSGFLWQGPSGSGVTGSTLASVTATVPGIYTLTVTGPSVTLTQTVNLVFANNPQPTITGNFSVCSGQSSLLQIAGTGTSAANWVVLSNTIAANTVSINFTPVANTTSLTASGTFSNNCPFTTSVIVNRLFPPSVTPAGSLVTICSGITTSLSFSTVLGQSVLWNTGATAAGIVVNPTVNTIYTSTHTAANGCTATGVYSVIVNPLPQVNLNNTVICAGNPAVINSSGAPGTYSWSNGSVAPGLTVSPQTTTSYSLFYTNLAGCSNTGTAQVIVNPNPVILNPGASNTLCLGSNLFISVNSPGVNSYTWSNGANGGTISVSPTINAIYTATVYNGFLCSASTSQTVIVVPGPTVTLGASNASVCAGESIALFAQALGATSYSWSNGQQTNTTIVYPTQTAYYYVTVTDLNGCQDSTGVILNVNACTGIKKQGNKENAFTIYPNPSNGLITVESEKAEKIEIFDEAGRLVKKITWNSDTKLKQQIMLSPGIYLFKSSSGSKKVIIEKD